MSDGLVGLIFIALIVLFVFLVASRIAVKLIWSASKKFIRLVGRGHH